MKHTYKLTYMYIVSVFIILNAGSCNFPKCLKTNKFHFHVPSFINVSISKSSNRFHMTLDNRSVFIYISEREPSTNQLIC
jgi:hypothetical protein